MITHEEKCRLLAGSILPFGKAEATELPDGSKALVGESTRWVLAKSATWEGLASEAYKVHELLRAVSLERDRNIVIVAGIDVGYVESWLEENVSEDVVPASARRIVAGTWMEEHGEDLVPPEYEAELEEATRDRAFELLEETDTPEWEDLASTDEEL